jgi:HPr kinase/phosphorylase
MLLHASCIALNHRAVLIVGPPGAGKSDLALRLIDAGAKLVADDQTVLKRDGNQLLASPPDSIAGIIEVRQVGLLRMDYVTAPAVLYIELTANDDKHERLPEPDFIMLEEIRVRRLRLPAFEASTPAKIRAALLYRAEPE